MLRFAQLAVMGSHDGGNVRGARLVCGLAILLLALAMCLGAGVSIAQDASSAAAAERQISDLNVELEGVTRELQVAAPAASILANKRTAAEQVRIKARQAAAALKAPIADLDTRLKQLGPAPSAEAAPELAAIASERQALNAARERFNAAERQLTLIAVEAEQLSARISGMQRDRFVQQIFETNRSILNPLLWWEGARSIAVLAERLATLLGVWYAEASARLAPGMFAAALIAIGGLPLLTIALHRLLIRRYEPVLRARSPSNFDRLWMVTRAVVFTGLVLLLLMIGVTAVLAGFGVATPRLESLLQIVFRFVTIFLLAITFARTVLAPHLPAWRLPRLDDATARRLMRPAVAAALLLAIDASTPPLVDLLFLPIAFAVGQSAVLTLLMCLVGLDALQTLRAGESQRAAPDEQARARKPYFEWLAHGTQLAWFIIVLGVVLLVLGYVALAHFVVFNSVLTLVYVSILHVVRQLIDELIAVATLRTSAVGAFLRQTMSLNDRAVARLGVFLGVAVDLIIAVIAIPLVILQWTDMWIDIGSWLSSGFFGFDVAGVTIEPASLVTAIAILLVGLAATNLITRWLDRRILSISQLDKGVRDSVKKGIGYAGVFLAGVLALTSAGVGFSNIAIIAGALGVGIGFGLQSIVNNFVSGVILLAERPVKVGDWIVVGAGEGFVKQINVRTTEIETFDNCTIIVPNSSLISEPVKNWTHHDTVGKMTIAVSVARDTEPEKVRDILLSCANAHKSVMRHPEPTALLHRFGENSLDFVLYFHVEDILWGVYVASDIRFAILKAFRQAKVVMPYPQHEVLLRRPRDEVISLQGKRR